MYHSLSSKWKKNMTSNISEVLLKTVPFNGVVYSDAEGLYSKKDLRSPYFRNIKTTYRENEVWRSINIYASDNLSIDWRTIYLFPWMNALFTLNLMSFSIKLYYEQNFTLQWFPFLKLECVSRLLSVRLVTQCFSLCFSFVQNFWNSIQLLFGSYIVSEVDVFLSISKPVTDSLLYNHLIFLSKQHIYSCKLKNTYTTGVVFLAKVKAVF